LGETTDPQQKKEREEFRFMRGTKRIGQILLGSRTWELNFVTRRRGACVVGLGGRLGGGREVVCRNCERLGEGGGQREGGRGGRKRGGSTLELCSGNQYREKRLEKRGGGKGPQGGLGSSPSKRGGRKYNEKGRISGRGTGGERKGFGKGGRNKKSEFSGSDIVRPRGCCILVGVRRTNKKEGSRVDGRTEPRIETFLSSSH